MSNDEMTHDTAQHTTDPMADPLTLVSLPADVLNVILDRIVRHHQRPAADLASLALTCSTLAQVAIPALYETLVVPTLPSLPLLDRTLTARADLAAQVIVLALGHAFMDGTQFDLSAGLSKFVKTRDGIAVANEDRIKYIGRDTQRSLVMAWMTHFAKLCPNLVGVDFARTWSLPSYHVLGFTNLSQVLRPRGGWFKPPAKHDFYLAAVAIHDPAAVKRNVGLVTAINWGERIIGLLRMSMPPETLNLSQIHDLIPVGDDELAKWTVGYHQIHEEEKMADDPGLLAQVFGIPHSSFAFTVHHDRLPKSASCSISMFNLPNALSFRGIRQLPPCKSLSILNPDIASQLFSTPMFMSNKNHYHQFIADLAPLKSSPWTSVTSLALGTPLFMPNNWLDSLQQLATIAPAFPNVTSLLLRTSCPAIADVLLACDPFLRRALPYGRPLRQLSISRLSTTPKLPELQQIPTDKNVMRTRLKQTGPTPHHLQKLVLMDISGMSASHTSWGPRPILVHPGLLHGLQHLSMAGVHVAVAPPQLVTPESTSFPSILALRPGDQPLFLSHATLPNMQMLLLNSDLARPNTQSTAATSLASALPNCPNLESLMIDINQYMCILSWYAAALVIEKYPRLRNVCLGCVCLGRQDLLMLADHLFSHPIREMRPVPMLARLVLANAPRHTRDVRGVWVAGPEVGAVWMSDIKIPADFQVVSPCPYLHMSGDPSRHRANSVPMAGTPCLCGRVKMGEQGAWIHPRENRFDVPVVCNKCCDRMDDRLRSGKSGVEIRCINPIIDQYPLLMCQGMLWPMLQP